MAKKKAGGKQKQKAAAAAGDDDDWDILNEAAAAATAAPPPKDGGDDDDDDDVADVGDDAAAKVGGGVGGGTDAGVDAAEAFLAAQGISDGGGGGAADKKKKKKKKKAGGGGGDDEAPGPAPAPPPSKNEKISAKGRLIAERMRLQREEEDRLRALEEAERLRIEEIERREAEEEEKIRLEKERKRLKEKEKKDRQKREGTYMTKKQKQQAALAQQRLEAMRAAGMEVPSGTGPGQRQQRPAYGNKKKSKARVEEEEEEDDDDDGDEEEEAKIASEGEEAGKVEEEESRLAEERSRAEEKKKDDDDDDDSGDEWDADSDASGPAMDALEKRLMEATSGDVDDGDDDGDEDEDLIEKEKRKELERLAQLGRERAERERVQAIALAEMRAQEEEMQRREMLLAQKREEGKRRRLAQEEANLAARTRDDLRCPVVVIMGHVDTGKTKLLDKIRKTNVQEGEAGGITQQIGATYFEKKTLLAQTARLNETEKFELTLPGMLVIDTPGHESFTNLRSRGSSLCDVAILVVDLMHGLEQQTIESLQMLRNRGTPFVVALNKVDRSYDWKTCKDSPIRDALKVQPEGTIQEFRSRAGDAKLQLQEQGVNSNIYWEMGDDDWENSDFVPLVPTSAITGEGVQDILLLLCQISQRKLWRRLMRQPPMHGVGGEGDRWNGHDRRSVGG
jgi:translation initiation factor 5B